MAHPILVPQVGQDLTEATIVELHVKLGDRVKKGRSEERRGGKEC